MTTIMLAIRRRHINNLAAGVKPYELRSTAPRAKPPYRVLLCQTGTGGEVVGEFNCTGVVDLTLCDDDRAARYGCVTPDEVRGYRRRDGRIYGWQAEDVKLYPRPSRSRSSTISF